ncbi:MAG: aldehyde dehydrogenase family protein [Bacteroidota bacterium]
MDLINPANEQLITSLDADDQAMIQRVYRSARAAQIEWAARSLMSRVEILQAFHDSLETYKDELAFTLTEEMGKPVWQAHNELNGARGRIAWLLENAPKYLQEEWVTQEAELGEKIVYEPLGVIGNISAWNYPYLVGVNVFIPALLAGNAVVYKPSEYTTLTGLRIERLLHEAGVPRDVFQTLSGGAEAGKAILELPLDGYFFTGSYRTGKAIYQKVATKMVPCQLELGGKDPMYVTADTADVASIAKTAVEGAFYNSGQSCCAVERIYVHQDIYDEFVEGFVAEAANWKVGDPKQADTLIGPLARGEQVHFLQQQVGDAVLKGAKIVFGEERWEGKGYYFIPTVLTEVNHRMRIMTEESFGPVIGIQKVKNDAEAIKLMLDTEYGLTAAVYSDHFETAEPILKAMNSGTVYWNACDRVSAPVPWSGRKHSGIGSTLSHIGIRAFTQPKAYQMRGRYQ